MSHLNDSHLYLNRELSNLAYFERILQEACNPDQPLLERAKFLAIFASNLDEFYMVRVSGLKQQVFLGITDTPPDGLTPRQQLASISHSVNELFRQQMACWNEQIWPQLAEVGIHILTYDEFKKKQQRRLRNYFEEEIYPVLTPLAFDPGHPFPHISNLSINLAVVIRDPETGETHFARLKVPGNFPRLIPLPAIDGEDSAAPRKVYRFVWIEQVVAASLDRLFPGMEVIAAHPFRVTRNTDMDIQEEEADDLLLTMEQSLRQRHFGVPVRLEIEASMPQEIRELLVDNLEVEPQDVYTVNGPLDLSSLWELYRMERPEIKDTSYKPSLPARLRDDENIFTILKKRDVLIHLPYDSFSPVVKFLEAAANDPDVLAIKQTLYRVGPNPPIVKALMQARDNGKQVAVLVELKARFDEKSNIEWAKTLEATGVHVVYGLIGLKTHAKLSLVVRKEKDGIRRYVHVATGNYNTNTARIYGDLGLMTSDPAIGADASDVFNSLTGYSKQAEYRKFWVAPVNLRQNLLNFIDREISHGSEGRIIFKINSLVDDKMIRALYRAAQAGVKIDLIVRGICCLRPGIPGISENIRVLSIVGRYLEHSRIYYFHNKGTDDVYIGSADLMPRNLDRRVEVVFPIEDKELRDEIINHILLIQLRDTAKSRWLQADGSYIAAAPADGVPPFNSQQWFMDSRRQ
ncbi:MAG: polyphosphate kinase 1 [Chloroflexi bacterium]|nr:polyphosphate kinase 1 [Chloroflexota bacterium]MBP8054429.1 polyphosphate kinase 1 [Chloroflexota bacterium]